jgi:serine/threonine-protein kinase
MPATTNVRSRYELREVINKGGMGVVYRAWDTLMKRDVALKTILDVHSRAAFDLFYKEWGLQASIIHPNIIEIYDIGEFEDGGVARPYFVMPLLPGSSLSDLIKNASQRLTVERSVEIMNQVCRGLQAAHERGLIHRDIKPSNVFVMADDSVKIIDFGIAFAETGATHTAMRGTLPYMAPELLQLKPPSVLTDIFALGAVTYEALTRRRAFAGKNDTEISNAVLRTNPPPASELNPSVTLLLSQVVHKALAKQPWHRYSSAREFGDTLLRAIHNEPIAFLDRSRVLPRIERAARAFERGEYQFATEILDELEGEGHIDPDITVLRHQVEQAGRQLTVKQILESARRFYEEEEYSLSLRKIQEALELDPSHSEALALKSQVERNRRAKQLEEWSQLARQHLENNAFEQARGAIRSLLDLKPSDPGALDLLAEVDRRAQEFETRRQEKSKLYDDAVEAWQKGEVNSALSRLERWAVLDRELPDTDSARVLSRQNFYNQVRGEDEALRSALEQARKLLAGQDFTGALEICDRSLAKYPAHALFQALRFDIEERRRKNLSAFLAETDRRVESEPDLDKRCGMLEEAARRHPGEPHLERALRLARDKRNLVNSVVQKARSQEEQGRYAEALETWEMLGAIYGQYPGLEHELARAGKRRDSTARNEAQAAWVERVDKLLESREFEKAAGVAENALAEFPDDPEIKDLAKLAGKRIATGMEVAGMLQAGREACLAGKHEEGLNLMRAALDLDPGDPVLRATLLDTLAERARELADKDPHGSEALLGEVLQLDPDNASALSLRKEGEDARRSEFVYWCTEQARRLESGGDLEGARAVVWEGLARWPREPGLLQLAATLGEADAEAPPLPTPAAPVVKPSPTLPPSPSSAHASELSRVRFADTAGELAVRSAGPSAEPPPPPPVSPIVEAPPPPSTGRPAHAPVYPLPAAQAPALPSPVAQTPALPPTAAQAPASSSPVAQTPALPSPAAHAPRRHLPMWQAVLLAAIGTVALAFIARYLSTHTFAPKAPIAATVPISVSTNPPGAHIAIDGKDRGVSPLTLDLSPGTHAIAAALDGYVTASQQVNVVAQHPRSVQIGLTPLPPSLRVITDTDSADVKLDDQDVAGTAPEFTADHVGVGRHKLTLSSRQGEATAEFDISPGALPVMDGPVQTKNVNAVVLSQFGARAWLYSSEPLQVAVDNGAVLTATPGGIELPPLSPGSHSLTIGEGTLQRNLGFTSGAAPELIAFVEQKGAPESGGVLVLTGEDGASVFINGKQQRRLTKNGQMRIGNLKPGDYSIHVIKDGFESPAEQKVTVRKGEDARVQFQLKPVVRMSALRLEGALAGAEVLIDENAAGTVQADGSFVTAVPPGTHSVALRNGGAESHPIQRQFGAGQTVQFGAGELALQAPQGVLRVHVSPANAHVTIRAEAERESAARPVTQESLTLAEGTYVVSAAAPDYNPSATTVTVAAGAQAAVDIALTAKAKPAPAALTGMSRWDDAKGWTQEGEWQIHKGGNFLSFQAEEINGRIEFNALLRKGKRLEWFLARADDHNYVLFRLDKKNLVAERFVNGNGREVAKTQVNFDRDQPIAARIDVSAGTVTTMIRQGAAWTTMSPLSDSGGNLNKGRFGLHIPGKDEVGINSFAYYPK